MVAFDTNLLSNYYAARSGASSAGSTGGATPGKKYAPTAPWSPTSSQSKPAVITEAVKKALLGHKMVDENAAQLDLAGAGADYKKLFALYQGLTTLNGVAERMNAKGLTSVDKAQIQRVFAKGLAEVTTYSDALDLDALRLTRGEALDKNRTVGVPKAKTEYVTAPLITGDSSQVVAAFQGDVKFNFEIKRVNVDHTIAIDLSEMGSTPRTFANVINHINDKLAADGVQTRIASQRLPGKPRTVDVNGKKVTLAATQDSWALKVKVDSGETVKFTTAQTAGAVYLAQSIGNPDPDGKPATKDGTTERQLLKFQTDTTAVASPLQATAEANWVEGRAWSEAMGKEVETVRATAAGPDGSFYALADITAKTGDQVIKGTRDVALMKYDSAGKLVFSRTLGAAEDASGLALAVSADGQVAIAGSVKGTLKGATEGALNSGDSGTYSANTDSFVTLFDADGQEVWTQRRGARLDDEANRLAFGADGAVYVAGRTRSQMSGTSTIGGFDTYIQGFKANAAGKVETLFTQQFGTTEGDKPAGLLVDGTGLLVAANENGHAVVRRFELGTNSATQTAIRDLGDLQGGDLTGIGLDNGKLVVVGNANTASLSAGTVTRAFSGGTDAFAAQISTSLTAAGTDRLAFYGGAGSDRATAMAVADGQVWLTGTAGSDLPGQTPVGTKDGFLTRLNIDAGTVEWSRRFTGKDGYAAPTAIALDTAGSSVLDRLGLPKGTLDMQDSTRITAVSAVRGGDSFQVRAGTGTLKTVTIENNDTLDTLATKLRRALSYQAKIEIVPVDGVRKLQVKPLNPRNTLEFLSGKGTADALEVLGLSAGVVRTTVVNKDGKSVPADGKGNIYGLSLKTDLTLDTPEAVRHVLAELATAQGAIRTAYKDLAAAATPKAVTAATAAATGKVPTYLSNQISNYQAALDRLGG